MPKVQISDKRMPEYKESRGHGNVGDPSDPACCKAAILLHTEPGASQPAVLVQFFRDEPPTDPRQLQHTRPLAYLALTPSSWRDIAMGILAACDAVDPPTIN